MNMRTRTIASFFTVAMAAMLLGAVVTTQIHPGTAMARPADPLMAAAVTAAVPRPQGPLTLDTFRDVARLQNPLGLCVDPRGLAFVADSYNGKIKALNLRTGEIRPLNLPYHLHEPSGISMAANALWVANTNAHEVVRVDLATGQIKRVAIS